MTARFFSRLQRVEQAAPAAVFTPSLLLMKMAGLFKVGDGALDGAAGELQLLGDGADGGIASAFFVGTIPKVHVDGFRPVGQILRVDGCKITHGFAS